MRKFLLEYRDTGAIRGAYLADPADAGEEDVGALETSGPPVDEIDWDGIAEWNLWEKRKYRLYWNRADGQGSQDEGEYPTRSDAEAAIPLALRESLAQCATDEQRAEINAGHFTIDEEEQS